jgi:N-ethylmaleimide reductase
MKLLESIKVGNKILKNRMAMAPMTSSRANTNGIVGNSTVSYYTQRASAGLIISEAINISMQAIGSLLTPGIYTQEQITAWKNVTQAVAPSALSIEGQQHFTMEGMKDYEIPRAFSTGEVKNRRRRIKKRIAKFISYGSLFLAHPDLPKRFELNAELNQPDRTTMYGGKDEGYIDYPFSTCHKRK